MTRRNLVVVAWLIVFGVTLGRHTAAAQEMCRPADGLSEPTGDDPDIVGTPWPLARDELDEAGFDIETRPAGLDEAIADDAVVLDWVVDTPLDDVNPSLAVVCLGQVVPDVKNETRRDAEATVRTAGSPLMVSPANAGVDWTVIDQEPAPGGFLFLGIPVVLLLAAPTVTVPDLTGWMIDDARAILEESGLVLGQVAGPGDGVTVSQAPEPGALVPPGQAVDLITELSAEAAIPATTSPAPASVTAAPSVTTAPPASTGPP